MDHDLSPVNSGSGGGWANETGSIGSGGRDIGSDDCSGGGATTVAAGVYAGALRGMSPHSAS